MTIAADAEVVPAAKSEISKPYFY